MAVTVYLHSGVHITLIMDTETQLWHAAQTSELDFDRSSESAVAKTPIS